MVASHVLRATDRIRHLMNSHMRFTTGTAALIGQLHSSDTSKMSPPTSERDGQACRLTAHRNPLQVPLNARLAAVTLSFTTGRRTAG